MVKHATRSESLAFLEERITALRTLGLAARLIYSKLALLGTPQGGGIRTAAMLLAQLVTDDARDPQAALESSEEWLVKGEPVLVPNPLTVMSEEASAISGAHSLLVVLMGCVMHDSEKGADALKMSSEELGELLFKAYQRNGGPAWLTPPAPSMMLLAEKAQRESEESIVNLTRVFLQGVGPSADEGGRETRPKDLDPNPIPPEYRSFPIQKKQAAKWLGQSSDDSGVRWLNKCIEDGTITCFGVSKRRWMFDIRQFPAAAKEKLTAVNRH